jgi:thioredoxin-like negative regulator of GroEL
MNDIKSYNLPLDARANVRPRVILFIKPDCDHSAKFAKTLDAFAKDYQGCLDFLTIDITQRCEWGRSFQVSHAPALAILVNGQIVYQALGSLPERELIAVFDSVLRSHATANLK